MPQLIHCSYHKCLTVFFRRVMEPSLAHAGGYRHYNSDLARFQAERSSLRLASVNNLALDVEGLGDVRISRFVRDPRDLIVSGYLYHRRGAEPWCREVDPDPEEWLTKRNRDVPSAMAPGESLEDCLRRVDQEDGLLAEMELRARHFDSMRAWSADDPRIRVWRYEDILGNERRVMGEVAAHYELPLLLRRRIQRNAVRFDSSHIATRDTHVRNPSSGQWRSMFSSRVESEFSRRWGDLLPLFGYDDDELDGAVSARVAAGG
jgi:hypothetical protein